MKHRPQIGLCPEGYYYIFVILFIIGGAVLREVNLLVLLAGMMIAPLIFNWRLVAITLRGVTVRRTLPKRVEAGQRFDVELQLTNPRRRFSCWAVLAEDSISHLDPSQTKCTARAFFPRIAAGRSASTHYLCMLGQRGRYRFGPLQITSRFPLGLVRARLRHNDLDEVVVCPRLGSLTPQWNQIIQSAQLGTSMTSRRKGLVEGDYYGLREWRPGDSVRWIHWRTSAKLNELTVRQFEQQQNQDLALVVDLWQPENPSEDDRVRLELMISFAATVVVRRCQQGGSRLVIAVRGGDQRIWNAPSSQALAHEVLEYLATIDGAPVPDDEDVFLTFLRNQVRQSVRTVVISTRQAKSPASLAGSTALRDPTGVVRIDPTQVDDWFSL